MNENESKVPETVSYYDHQEQLAREERHTSRWRVFAIIIFITLVITNAAWIIYESSFQDVVVTENTQDGDGTNIIGGGSIRYGTEIEDSENKSQTRW